MIVNKRMSVISLLYPMPGYPAIGRLKGLGELRGVTKALEHKIFNGN